MEHGQISSIVRRIRRLGRDDEWVEAKACTRKLSAGIWESVSAFANTHGGLLLLGLDEISGFRPAVGFDPARTLDQFIDGIGDGGETGARLSNPPRYDPQTVLIDGEPVLAIEIFENPVNLKPSFISKRSLNGGSFKRIGDKDIRLSPTEIFEFQNATQVSEADRSPVEDAEIDDLDPSLVNRYMEANTDSRALVDVGENRELALRRLNITDVHGHVRFAGLLTMGRFPQQHYPQLFIDVAVHPSQERSSAGSNTRFVDRRLCEGPLADAVDDAVQAVGRNLRTYSTVTDSARQDQLEVPREVLREAISNAVLHREYSPLFRGQPVSVDVFPDRIEVTSPGGLWGGKTVDTLSDGQSRCRNATLLQILRKLPLSSKPGTIAEGNGSGVAFMVNQMRAHALPEPHFHVTPDSVTATLGRHGLEIPENRNWLAEYGKEDLTRHESSIVLLARQFPTLTVDLVRDHLQIDSDDVRGLLAALTRDGVLHSAPDGWSLSHDIKSARGQSTAEAVLDALSTDRPRSIREISESTGRTVNALRPVLRELVSSGHVTATAPPTSRRRKYLLEGHP